MEHLAITSMTLAACVTVGLVQALLGSVKLALARQPGRPDSHVRNLLSLLNLLLLPMVFVAGLLVDRLGVRPTLFFGSLLLCLSFLSLSAGLSYRRTLGAVFTAALGAALLHVATLVQMPSGLFGPDEVSASLQMGLVFVSLGALVGPPLLDVLLGAIGFRRSMALLAFLFLVPAFLTALPSPEQFPKPVGVAAVATALADPRVLVAGIAFFAYAPLEAFVSVWAAAYLTNLGHPERQSRWLACFWAAVALSRFTFALALHVSSLLNNDGFTPWFLTVPALLAAVVLGNMLGVTDPKRALTALILLGVFLGPVFPMLLGILFIGPSGFAPSGSVYGLLFAFGSVGSLVLSPLVHFSARRESMHAAMRVPLVLALAVAAAALMFALL